MTTTHPVKRRKKMIEVAIPLEAINAASAREKSIRHGHPSTLHLWWARRPLAAARAVIFCQMVDDPSSVPEEFPTEEAQELERLRLFALVSELVQWENTTNEEVLEKARAEIRRSWRRCCADNANHPEADELFNPDKLPGFHDPFAGGGALPLEAQRLGMESYASDLNPVAVLINKAMIEIPPKFAGMPPINPEARSKKELIQKEWKGAEGLAEDVRYYGQWMRDEAEKRIGHLYPKVKVTPEMVQERPDLKPYENQELTVVAWLWARTVKSPNPAFSQVDVPLASTFMLSSKAGKESYVQPVVDARGYRFAVKVGKPKDPGKTKRGTKLARGANFGCLMSGVPIEGNYIKSEGRAGEMGARLMAIVAEGKRGRVFITPTPEQEAIALSAKPEWKPETPLANDPRALWTPPYGLKTYGDLFTPRQLVALTTFSDLVGEAMQQMHRDAHQAGMPVDSKLLRDGGTGAVAYAEAVGVYLGMAVDRSANTLCSLARWTPERSQTVTVFARQAIPMTWDYPDVNPFSGAAGDYGTSIEGVIKGIPKTANTNGFASQADAHTQTFSANKLISTDPPYYDNIGYADLSDFFYVWMRRSLRGVFPELFTTIAVPKAEELIAMPYRHGSKEQAENFFLSGMTQAMNQLASQAHANFPLTIYYAFKQCETKKSAGSASTGWETFLAAVMEAGLAITGTWPMRTELSNRMISSGTNALASSVVLVCQRRNSSASTLTRNTFRRELSKRLPEVIKELEQANIAPVDVAQAAIGPGMAIFSSAKAVINPDDSQMSVRDALIEINNALDEYLSQEEGSFDPDSRFALTFYESYGYEERPYGDAEGLAVARNVSVDGVVQAGILEAIAGKSRLLKRKQLPADWDPLKDDRLCVWEATQHLIRKLEEEGEASAAATLNKLKQVPGQGDLVVNCRALAYRLYNHCEKTKQAEEALAYNGLIKAWPELEHLASSEASESTVQTTIFNSNVTDESRQDQQGSRPAA